MPRQGVCTKALAACDSSGGSGLGGEVGLCGPGQKLQLFWREVPGGGGTGGLQLLPTQGAQLLPASKSPCRGRCSCSSGRRHPPTRATSTTQFRLSLSSCQQQSHTHTYTRRRDTMAGRQLPNDGPPASRVLQRNAATPPLVVRPNSDWDLDPQKLAMMIRVSVCLCLCGGGVCLGQTRCGGRCCVGQAAA